MKYPLHADDFVIDDLAKEIIYKYRPKIQPADKSHLMASQSSECGSVIDIHGIVITQEKNLASRYNKGPWIDSFLLK